MLLIEGQKELALGCRQPQSVCSFERVASYGFAGSVRRRSTALGSSRVRQGTKRSVEQHKACDDYARNYRRSALKHLMAPHHFAPVVRLHELERTTEHYNFRGLYASCPPVSGEVKSSLGKQSAFIRPALQPNTTGQPVGLCPGLNYKV